MHNGRQWYTDNLLQPKGDCHGAFTFRRARGRYVSFAPLFSKRVFEHVKVLIAGAILAPRKRMVTSDLTGDG